MFASALWLLSGIWPKLCTVCIAYKNSLDFFLSVQKGVQVQSLCVRVLSAVEHTSDANIDSTIHSLNGYWIWIAIANFVLNLKWKRIVDLLSFSYIIRVRIHSIQTSTWALIPYNIMLNVLFTWVSLSRYFLSDKQTHTQTFSALFLVYFCTLSYLCRVPSHWNPNNNNTNNGQICKRTKHTLAAIWRRAPTGVEQQPQLEWL